VNTNGEQRAASAEAVITGQPAVLSLKEVGKTPKEWTLTFHPPHLALADAPGAQPYVILREEVMKSATLMEGMRLFVVQKPRKVAFKLTPEATAAIAEWIGKPKLAAYYLRRRYVWALPVGVLWIIGSIWLPARGPAGIDSLRFDPFQLAVGLALVVSWAFAKWRPHPAVFLAYILSFVGMAGEMILRWISARGSGWLGAVAVLVLLLWLVVTGLRQFSRFRGTRIARV
jgi:hypothetical protein